MIKIEKGIFLIKHKLDSGVYINPFQGSGNIIEILSKYTESIFIYREIEMYRGADGVKYNEPQLGFIGKNKKPFYRGEWKEVTAEDLRNDILYQVLNECFRAATKFSKLNNMYKVFGENLALDISSVSVDESLKFLSERANREENTTYLNKDMIDNALNNLSEFKEISNLMISKVREDLLKTIGSK